jgi:exopolysaccharide biosynthesis predicted pyruvyltransferase EpsI
MEVCKKKPLTARFNDDRYYHFLYSHKNRLFYQSPYLGNPGDLLICRATAAILSDIGIITTEKPEDAEIILYPGGCPTMWPAVLTKIEESLKKYTHATLVIGPATFEFGYTDWDKKFKNSGCRISGLFARDPQSYANLENANLPSNIQTGLSHDPSLYLLNSSWMEEQRKNCSQEYILTAFRRDHETWPGIEQRCIKPLKIILPEKMFGKMTRWCQKRSKRRKILTAHELSNNKLPFRDEEIWRMNFDDYVETIRRAKEVHTDRLHVMILGAMLGKKIYGYPTLYGKLENIYEHSLKDWADVTFVG